MKPKYTEGPWTLGQGMSFYQLMADLEDGGDEFVEIDADGHGAFAIVVWRMEDEKRSPRMEATARLITAAPDLLEALRDVVAISDRKHDAWDRAHAAIAKAEGVST